MAKALVAMAKLEAAEEEVKTARTLAPRDFAISLATAVIALRRATDKAALAKADELLQNTAKLYSSAQSQENWLCLYTVDGIVLALFDNVVDARKVLKQVVEYDPSFEPAQKALAALPPSQT